MPAPDSVRVALQCGGHEFAVVRDDGGTLYLIGSLEEPHRRVIHGFRPASAVLGDLRSVLGGRLPPGATSAAALGADGELVACTVAGGAWIVAVTEALGETLPETLVFRDRLGTPVTPPISADWLRTAVTDTDVRCPGCDACTWDQLTPTDRAQDEHRARHGRRHRPAARVACRTCGYQQAVPRALRLPHSDARQTPEAGARMQQLAKRFFAAFQPGLANVDFPVYGAEGWTHDVNDVYFDDAGDVNSVGVAQGAHDPFTPPRLQVRTEAFDRDRGELEQARRALVGSLRNSVPPVDADRSDAAVALQAVAEMRARQRAAYHATQDVCELSVAGQPVSFQRVRAGGRWAAVARLDSLTIIVSAKDVEPGAVRLRPIPDLVEASP